MGVFAFGPFVLDRAKRALFRNGTPQALTPKTFDVLSFLIEHRERVVSKDELLKTLWPDAFIEESNLTQHIFLLRRALNGDAEGPEYIATIPRRGYRFVAEVSEHADEQAPAAAKSAPPVARTQSRRTWIATSLVGTVMFASLLAIWAIRRVPDAAGTSRIIPVTAVPGVLGFPSISPDGNFVVFAWTGPQNAGPPDIWIKAVEDETLRQLTATPEGESSPMWSPDGRQVAFLRSRGVFVMSSLGGAERRVADSGSMLGWTPDSQSLLVRDRLGAGPFGIFQIDLATGARRQLTQAPSGMGDWTFDVSPDGTMLAFVRYERPGVSDVYVAPMAGGDPDRRTDWGHTISRVVWTPDQRELIYAVTETGVDQTLFRVPASGRRPERGRRTLHVSAVGPSLSRANPGQFARLAFINRREDIGLRLVDLAAPRLGDVFPHISRFSDSTRIESPGSFSRRGDRIAFMSDRSGSPNVWVSNRDGSELRRLTSFTAAEVVVGNWSPDDRRLVIDASVNGNSDVYLLGLDSGQVSRLTVEPSMDIFGHWSNDGRWIYFTSDRSGPIQAWRLPAEGGPAVPVTKAGSGETQEAPDGRTVFYLDHPPPGAGGVSGPSRLMKVSADGGDETVVLDGVRLGLWSVTEEGIVFLTIEKESDALDFYSFRDGHVRRLGTLPVRVSRVSGYGRLAVSHDGRLALVNVTDNVQTDIMVADGFR